MNNIIKITCGCHTEENPKQFDTVEAAIEHAKATGHTIHGSIVINRKV